MTSNTFSMPPTRRYSEKTAVPKGDDKERISLADIVRKNEEKKKEPEQNTQKTSENKESEQAGKLPEENQSS